MSHVVGSSSLKCTVLERLSLLGADRRTEILPVAAVGEGLMRGVVVPSLRQLAEEGLVQLEGGRVRMIPVHEKPFEPLAPSWIALQLLHKGYSAPVLYWDCLTSTQRMARRLADRGAPHGTIVVAGEQTEGRGRRGNRWCSPRRGGLYLTVVLRQGDSGALMPLLNLAAGLAVRESLQEESGISLALKWPNDVLYNGRKLCGILSEARTAGSTVQYLLLGIGVNTGPLAVFEGIPKQGALPAASLDELNTASLCRERIVVHLLCSLLQYLERQQQEGGREQLLETFARHCCSVGQRLRVRSASETFEAWGAGIGPDGSLLVDRNGETLVLRSEEVFQIREAPAIQSGT